MVKLDGEMICASSIINDHSSLDYNLHSETDYHMPKISSFLYVALEDDRTP